MVEERESSEVTLSKPFRFFKFVVRPHLKWLILSIILVCLASVIYAGSSYVFKLIVDAVEAGNTSLAMKYGLIYPIVMLAVEIAYRLSGFTVGNLTINVNKTAADSVFEYLIKHNHSYFSNRFAGSITNKVRNITGALDQVIPDMIWGQLDTLIRFVVIFIIIFSVDPLASLMFAVLLLCLGAVNKGLSQKKALLSKLNAEISTKLQGRAVDVVSNVFAVRQNVNQNYELEGFRKLTSEKKQSSRASWFHTEKMLLINSVIIFIFSFLIFGILVIRWKAGEIGSGDFLLVLALIVQITGSLLFIGRAFNIVARAVGELREGLEDIYIPHETVDMPGAESLVLSGGAIDWREVTFRYDETDLFSKLSLSINPRQKIGLVGASGAGKTTFVSLLLRQQDVTSGAILIDGQDISQITQDSLREAISLVPQEPSLFHRSIRDNIAYGKPGVTMDQIIEVAKLAHAHEFISKLPKGYDTLVGERGIKLSGGQKQRVAIARAMLKNSPILILDEATSALDSESERLIQKALHNLMEGKTVIAIAHRLSTLSEMDRIIVLESGKIVEDGTHDELKNSKGTYSKLWAHQAGGFLLDD